MFETQTVKIVSEKGKDTFTCRVTVAGTKAFVYIFYALEAIYRCSFKNT